MAQAKFFLIHSAGLIFGSIGICTLLVMAYLLFTDFGGDRR
jgi:hypothetical protein